MYRIELQRKPIVFNLRPGPATVGSYVFVWCTTV